jgi:hypothetical protein
MGAPNKAKIDDRTRLLGIEIAHQLGRALDVGEQRAHGLALSVSLIRYRFLGQYARWCRFRLNF